MLKIRYLVLLTLIFTSALADPFTPNNFMIVYVTESYNDFGSNDVYNTFIEEFTPDGTSVQVFEISSICMTNSNGYMGGPRLSTDGQHVTIACYIPNGIVTDLNKLTSTVGVLSANGELQTFTQFTMPTGKYWYHAIKDGNDIYFAGDNTISYIPLNGNQDQRIELNTGVLVLQDVFIYNGNLYITNYNSNNFGLAMVGSGLPVKTPNQVITQIWGSEIAIFPDTIKFFEKDGVQYGYMSQETPYTLYKLIMVNGVWTKPYNVVFNTGNKVISSHVFYDNDNGTTTVIFATDKNIYKTIDDGTQFGDVTLLVSRPNFVMKGIEKTPGTIVVPPVAPVSPPVNFPVDVPVAQPTNLGPISEPISEPISDPVPGSDPMTDVVPSGDAPMTVDVPVTSNGPSTNSAPSTKLTTSGVESSKKIIVDGFVLSFILISLWM